MKQLVIFDLDGTLLNTLTDLAESTNYALQLHGFPTHPTADYRYMVGNGIRVLIQRALPESARTPEVIERVLHDFKTYYLEHGEDCTQPYEGIFELIETLKNRGITLAIATNKFQIGAEQLVHRFFGTDTFELILGQREGIAAKPDPIIVHQILAHTQCPHEKTLYIGDTSVDMQTAVRAGVTAVGVTWGFRPLSELLEHGADYVIDTPIELLDLI